MMCPIEQKTPLEQVEAFLECPQGNLTSKDLLFYILVLLKEVANGGGSGGGGCCPENSKWEFNNDMTAIVIYQNNIPIGELPLHELP